MVHVKPYVFDKMYMDKELIEDKLSNNRSLQWKTNYVKKQNTSTLWWKWKKVQDKVC